MFFTQFTKEICSYSRKLLDYCFIPAAFTLIWLYGNQEIFIDSTISSNFVFTRVIGEESQDGKSLITSSENTFAVSHSDLRSPSYGSALLHRSQDTLFASSLELFILGYFVFLLLKFLFEKINHKIYSQTISQGIDNFKDGEKHETSPPQFEDLVPANDIIYSKSLFHLQKGREIGSALIAAMHTNRMARLIRNLKRKVKRNRTRMEFGLEHKTSLDDKKKKKVKNRFKKLKTFTKLISLTKNLNTEAKENKLAKDQ